MISLTRKTDYALLALSRLARQPGTVVSAREIAEQFRISQPLLMNVLKELAGRGMISSVRGRGGGYVLARPAGAITLAELLDVMEGPVRLAPCIGGAVRRGGVDVCRSNQGCPVHRPLSWLQQRLEKFFEGITLHELAGANTRPAGEADDSAPVPTQESGPHGC